MKKIPTIVRSRLSVENGPVFRGGGVLERRYRPSAFVSDGALTLRVRANSGATNRTAAHRTTARIVGVSRPATFEDVLLSSPVRACAKTGRGSRRSSMEYARNPCVHEKKNRHGRNGGRTDEHLPRTSVTGVRCGRRRPCAL